jgi:hypothetical protein
MYNLIYIERRGTIPNHAGINDVLSALGKKMTRGRGGMSTSCTKVECVCVFVCGCVGDSTRLTCVRQIGPCEREALFALLVVWLCVVVVCVEREVCVVLCRCLGLCFWDAWGWMLGCWDAGMNAGILGCRDAGDDARGKRAKVRYCTFVRAHRGWAK